MLVTFDFLETWNFDKELPAEVRTKETIEKYKIFKLKLNESNISIEDHIKNKYIGDKLYSFDLNAFPYNVDENMVHYVLWINPFYRNKITDKLLCELLVNKMIELGYDEYFCFENHIKAKSVSDILHYQVFFKKC